MVGAADQFTDFYIEPLFVLEKADGHRIRMLNVHTRHGEIFGFNPRRPRSESNRPLEMTGAASKSPTCLREWLADRASGNWGTGEGEILTCPIVIGQATSSDSATRSRYPHVQMSQERRLPRPGPGLPAAEAEKLQRANFEWLKQNMGRFWWVGRWILEHRRDFTERITAAMAEWESDEAVSVIRDERTRLVYGVVYAGFAAFTRLIGMADGEREASVARWLGSYRQFLVGQAQIAVSEVRQQNELERFWQKVIGCFTMGGFGETPDELKRFFKAVRVGELPRPPGIPEASSQRGALGPDGQPDYHWVCWNLRIEPNAMFEALSRYVRQQNENLPLKMMDVRAQMSTMPYWVPAAAKARFDGFPVRYWEISLDRFPELGYRPCTDEEVQAAVAAGDEDPRSGAIYRVIMRLRQRN